ncbi:hypothetical protein PENTCL1PPCAC_26901 [Pristionchus entomophagus]|uniref:C2H2-type domain-containing protein n=1 Tax=Pristionchus entomophagus TaxID=358040 RepID=A0AAV5UDV3_9BILA|nr:hypothetical protein PENTCL1PPCAC_26901 [Pristionchus entomophagus]
MILSDPQGLKTHSLQHKEGEENQRPFKCDLCDMRFRLNGQVNQHKKVKHRGINGCSPNSQREYHPERKHLDPCRQRMRSLIYCTYFIHYIK